jgi:DNA repair photolyase
MSIPPQRIVGRGTSTSPANRFESARSEDDLEHLDEDDELLAEGRRVATQFLPDGTQSILNRNDSTDIPFTYSINPYRGCEHGCAYCYARPGHEMLGLNAGIDFETKIMVKHRAAELLRDELNHPRWQPQTIAISGVTDCYQPAERQFQITRGCLQVLAEARNPAGIVTKNALVVRDVDVLSEMARHKVIHVYISLTSLDQQLTRVLEPRTSSPDARLQAIADLRAAGVPVGVMVAPIIPGLNDQEIPAILQAAADAGAMSAGTVMLRLPYAVAPIFEAWLREHRPLQADRVLGRIRDVRHGKLNATDWGERMRGDGPYAEMVLKTFRTFANKVGFAEKLPTMDASGFVPPRPASGQGRLF